MKYILFFFIGICTLKTNAVITPKNGSVVHFTQILFECDPVAKASRYRFSIYETTTNKLIHSQENLHPYILSTYIFKFGTSYKWRVDSYDSLSKLISKSPMWQFKTGKNNRTKHNGYHVEITKWDTSQTSNGIILMDNNIIINRKGEIIFNIDSSTTFVRDLTLTNTGTFTYLDSTIFYEINKNKKISWKSPSINNDSIIIKDYHHDIQKTKKGTYLCIANVFYKKFKQQLKFSAIIEFDINNRILWIWQEKDHYPNDSLIHRASHMNSIFYDEENEKIYASNRDLASIIKIDKITGNIEYSYGYFVNDSVPFYEQSLFKMQHRMIKLPNDHFLIFNNDTGSPSTAVTKVLELSNPELGNGNADVLWAYEFSFPNQIENFIPRMGGAIVLPNNNVLISTGVFDRVFEINRDGNIVWEARISIKPIKSDILSAIPCYRANYASSLFPYHIIAYKKSAKELRLINAGTDTDTYHVIVKNNNGTTSQASFSLTPNSFVDIPVLSVFLTAEITSASSGSRQLVK